MNTDYIITDEMIKEAFDKGANRGNSTTLNYKKDFYNNLCFPHLTLTGQISLNPYTITGSGKKLKAAWHNGFRSTVYV